MGGSVFVDCEEIVDFKDRVECLIELLSRNIFAKCSIAICINDNLKFLVAYEAINGLGGCVPIIVNSRHIVEETAYQAGASFLLTWDDNEPILNSLKSSEIILPDDTAVVCQTSGSLGRAKFVRWSYKNVEFISKVTADALGYDDTDRLMITMPLSGAYGLSIVNIWRRSSVDLVLLTSVRPGHMSKVCCETRSTSFDGTPQLYHVLLNWLSKDSVRRGEWKSVRLWCSGGDNLRPSLAEQWWECMQSPILDGYGLTEAGPNVALGTPRAFKPGTVGRPLAGVCCKLSSESELLVRGPGVAPGYWPPNDLGTDLPMEDGWLKTGDIASIDGDGFLTIRGRLRNLIIVNGRNYCPEELEVALSDHPAMGQSVVLEMQGSRGSKIGILIQCIENSSTYNDEYWRRECIRLLPGIPVNKVVVVEKLPVSINGKLDRKSAALVLQEGFRGLVAKSG